MWSRNDYLTFAQSNGTPEQDAVFAWQQATLLQQRGLPAVLTLKHLASMVDVSYQYLRTVVSRRVDPYRVFRIRKRSGGVRYIAVADPGLAKAQRWIDRAILTKVPPHLNAMAYSAGSSIVRCAARHAGCRWMIKCDVQQFFESISEIQVYRVFREIGYEPLVSFEMTRLTTRVMPTDNRKYRLPQWQQKHPFSYSIESYNSGRIGHLPQGAVTSPRLSNLAAKRLDEELTALAKANDLNYSRYADDIILSSYSKDCDRNAAQHLIRKVYERMRSNGLRSRTAKTRIVPPGARKIVLGLCVNGNVPRLTKEFKRRIETHVHFLQRFGLQKHASNRGFDSSFGFREHFRGLLCYARQVDEAFYKKQIERLSSTDWENF